MLIVCYIIAYKVKDRKRLKRILRIYNVILAILAFLYIPYQTADLYRHFMTFDKYATTSFIDIFNGMNNSTVPFAKLYIFLFSKIGIKGLLPAVTSFIFHACVFHIIYVSAEKYNYSMKTVALMLLLFMEMGKFLEVISGIRCLLAFSVICYCIFEELFNNKSFYKHILLYAIACFFHSAAVALTIIRLFFLLFQKERRIIYKFVNIGLLVCLVIYFAFNSSVYLDAMFDKADGYLSNTRYYYLWEYIISLISILFMIISIFLFNKKYRNVLPFKNISNFVLLLCFLLLFYHSEYSIFSRFQTAASILFIPIYGYILNYIANNKSKYYKNVYIFIIIVVNISIFLIAGTRGNLSAYKFFIR